MYLKVLGQLVNGAKTVLMKWRNVWAPERPQDMSKDATRVNNKLSCHVLGHLLTFEGSKGREFILEVKNDS